MLIAYAISSVFLIALRKLPGRTLIAVGVAVFALSIGTALLTQNIANTTDAPISGIWAPGERADDEATTILVLLGFLLRAMGLILVGAGLYRMGFMNGGLPARTYRLTAIAGLAIGLPLAVAGVVVTAVNDYSREIAFVGQIPNTIGTIPFSLAYMSLNHPVEQPHRQLAEGAPARGRENGVDELPGADGAWPDRLDRPTG